MIRVKIIYDEFCLVYRKSIDEEFDKLLKEPEENFKNKDTAHILKKLTDFEFDSSIRWGIRNRNTCQLSCLTSLPNDIKYIFILLNNSKKGLYTLFDGYFSCDENVLSVGFSFDFTLLLATTVKGLSEIPFWTLSRGIYYEFENLLYEDNYYFTKIASSVEKRDFYIEDGVLYGSVRFISGIIDDICKNVLFQDLGFKNFLVYLKYKTRQEEFIRDCVKAITEPADDFLKRIKKLMTGTKNIGYFFNITHKSNPESELKVINNVHFNFDTDEKYAVIILVTKQPNGKVEFRLYESTKYPYFDEIVETIFARHNKLDDDNEYYYIFTDVVQENGSIFDLVNTIYLSVSIKNGVFEFNEKFRKLSAVTDILEEAYNNKLLEFNKIYNNIA